MKCQTGFSVGFLSVIAIMNYGIKGVLLLLGFFFPQWLFYVPALILWYYEVRYYKGAGRTAAYGEQKTYARTAATVCAS